MEFRSPKKKNDGLGRGGSNQHQAGITELCRRVFSLFEKKKKKKKKHRPPGAVTDRNPHPPLESKVSQDVADDKDVQGGRKVARRCHFFLHSIQELCQKNKFVVGTRDRLLRGPIGLKRQYARRFGEGLYANNDLQKLKQRKSETVASIGGDVDYRPNDQ